MVTYNHDLSVITEATAKALLGKRSNLIDVIIAYANKPNKSVNVVINILDSGTCIHVSTKTVDEELGVLLNMVTIRYNDKRTEQYSVTQGEKLWYKSKEDYHPATRTTVYRDWVVPTSKKLQVILEAVL